MADIDLENLKTVFSNMADRLSKTEGDSQTIDQLIALQKAIAKLENAIKDSSNKSSAENNKLADQIAEALIDELEKSKLASDIGEQVGNNVSDVISQNQIQNDPNVFNSSLKEFLSKTKKSIVDVTMASEKFASGSLKFYNNVTSMDGSFSKVAKAFGLGETSLGAMAAMIDENVDAYRSLMNSAEGTIGSLSDMREAMGVASVSATELATNMDKGGQGTRLAGAMPWAELFKGIKEQTKALGYYGYTSQQLQESVNDYLAISSNTGDMFKKPLTAEDLDKLLVVNQDIASILGTTRKEQMEAAKKASMDTAFNTLLAGLDVKNKELVTALVGGLESFSPEITKVYKDLVANAGGISNQENAMIFAQLPKEAQDQLRTLAEQTRNNTIDSSKIDNQIQDLAAGVQNMSKAQLELTGRMSAQAGGAFQGLSNIFIASSKVKQTSEEERTKGTEQNDAATRGLLQVGQESINAASGLRDLTTQLMNPVLKNFGGSIESGVTGIGDMIQTARNAISALSTFETTMLALGTAVLAGPVISSVALLVTKVVTGGLGKVIGLFGETLFKGLGVLGSAIGGVTDFFKTKFSNIIKSSLGKSSTVGEAVGDIADSADKVKGKGRLGKIANIGSKVVGGAAGIATGAAIGAEIGPPVGEAVGEFLVNNFPNASAWINENIFGNKTDPEAVKKLNELNEQGKSVDEYLSEPVAETVSEPTEIKDTKLERSDDILSDIADSSRSIRDILFGMATKESNIDFNSLNNKSEGKEEKPIETYMETYMNPNQNDLSNRLQEVQKLIEPLSDLKQINETGEKLNNKDSSANINQILIDKLDKLIQVLQNLTDLQREGSVLTIDRLSDLKRIQEDLVRKTRPVI